MLDPSQLKKCLKKITEKFAEHYESKGKSLPAIQKMTKQAQKLINHLKQMPTTAYSREVIEVLELFSSICPIEEPDIYKPCALVIQQIILTLPNPELLEIWKRTQDMNLCSHISDSPATIETCFYFEKLCTFIENPSIEDPTWFRRFVKLLKCKLDGEIDYNYVLPFTLYMSDISPLRSTVAFLILNTFSQLNARVAITIAASWLICDHKNPIISNNCRSILKKAPPSTLNMLATLSFDIPIIFPILPPEIEGYHTVCMITIHRLKSFMPDSLSKFLCLCDIKAREIIHRETSSKNKAPSLKLPNLSIPRELQLYDAANTASRSRAAISEMMEADESINFLASVVLFVRRCPYDDGSFLPQQTAHKITQALRQVASQTYSTDLKKIPCSEYFLEEIKNISEMIEKCQIMNILKSYSDKFGI